MNLDTTVETLANLPNIICFECKNGFVETMPVESYPTFVDCFRNIRTPRVMRTCHPRYFLRIKINLRIELEGWDNDEDDDDDRNGDEFHNVRKEENEAEEDGDRSDKDNRDFVTLGRSRRSQILDWAEILMGLDDNTLEFRLEVPELDWYVGNQEDNVDVTGYEVLLQTLVNRDGSGKRRAPLASKTKISGLPTMEV
ncbi:hypothetical protein UlMin_011698 [Ulmus minor]